MEKIEEKSVYGTKEKLDGGEKKRKNNVDVNCQDNSTKQMKK
jgi:hypothetical protein